MDVTEDMLGQQSKINSASFINLRMHDLWVDAHNHKRKGEYSKWNGDLDAVWCELGGDLKEGDNLIKDFNKINSDLATNGPILNWTNAFGHNKPNIKAINLKSKQYKILLDKELFLRRLQNKQGKGTAYAQEEDDWE